jgi:hypothetical protein
LPKHSGGNICIIDLVPNPSGTPILISSRPDKMTNLVVFARESRETSISKETFTTSEMNKSNFESMAYKKKSLFYVTVNFVSHKIERK